MESRLRNNYFVLVKLIGILGLIIWGLFNIEFGTYRSLGMLLTGALFLMSSVLSDMSTGKVRWCWIVGEGILAIVAVFLFPVVGVYYAAIVYLDSVGQHDSQYYLGVYFSVVMAYYLGINPLNMILGITFLMLIFFQQYKVISWYKKTVGENMVTESQLKSDMEHSNLVHKDELKQSRLRHENDLLEEKNRIAQALHDKLGHSINGSLYKLEAVKVLIEKDPDESTKILQDVIDNLRGSMDEIRVIIRNERPDKNKMALKSLQALCVECEEQYGIKTTLEISEDNARIPENIWEIILDNTFEAVTNSLKYSGCDEINININVLGEVVRCSIKDNGKGADNIEDGMGIQGMKQRVRNVKGYFDIEASDGFMINMILPVK